MLRDFSSSNYMTGAESGNGSPVITSVTTEERPHSTQEVLSFRAEEGVYSPRYTLNVLGRIRRGPEYWKTQNILLHEDLIGVPRNPQDALASLQGLWLEQRKEGDVTEWCKSGAAYFADLCQQHMDNPEDIQLLQTVSRALFGYEVGQGEQDEVGLTEGFRTFYDTCCGIDTAKGMQAMAEKLVTQFMAPPYAGVGDATGRVTAPYSFASQKLDEVTNGLLSDFLTRVFGANDTGGRIHEAFSACLQSEIASHADRFAGNTKLGKLTSKEGVILATLQEGAQTTYFKEYVEAKPLQVARNYIDPNTAKLEVTTTIDNARTPYTEDHTLGATVVTNAIHNATKEGTIDYQGVDFYSQEVKDRIKEITDTYLKARFECMQLLLDIDRIDISQERIDGIAQDYGIAPEALVTMLAKWKTNTTDAAIDVNTLFVSGDFVTALPTGFPFEELIANATQWVLRDTENIYRALGLEMTSYLPMSESTNIQVSGKIEPEKIVEIVETLMTKEKERGELQRETTKEIEANLLKLPTVIDQLELLDDEFQLARLATLPILDPLPVRRRGGGFGAPPLLVGRYPVAAPLASAWVAIPEEMEKGLAATGDDEDENTTLPRSADPNFPSWLK